MKQDGCQTVMDEYELRSRSNSKQASFFILSHIKHKVLHFSFNKYSFRSSESYSSRLKTSMSAAFSDLESLKDPLEDDVVWVVDRRLLRHVLDLHLGLFLMALLFLFLLLLLLPLLFVLLLPVPALAIFLEVNEEKLSKSLQNSKLDQREPCHCCSKM